MAEDLFIKHQKYITVCGVTYGFHVLQGTKVETQVLTVPYMGGNSTDTAKQIPMPAHGHPAITVTDNGAYAVSCAIGAGETGRDFVVVTQHGYGGNLNTGAEDDDHFD